MIFLGIDGGGSKTAFLLEDESGQPLAHFETGPSNRFSVGETQARHSIISGLAQLPATPDIVCGGFAGAGRPEGLRFYQECIRSQLPNAKVIIEGDAFIAYAGAIGIEPGVLLIAGTGSIAIGRRPDGAMIRAGGWGPFFGDEGSGHWIGREAVRRALRLYEDHSESPFVSAITAGLGLKTIPEVVAAWSAGTTTVQSIAALAPVVFEQYPDEPANRILREAANHLRGLAEEAIDRVGLSGCRKSIIGSVGHHPVMRQLIGMEFDPPLLAPERGAILWARSQRVTMNLP
jgi:N-acetylglucosamine kinase-like BadF-type ATPase